MNPNSGISPAMSTNEAVRRFLNVFVNTDGSLRPGAPGGAIEAYSVGTVIRVAATGPSPTPAALLIAADDKRIGGLLRNTDPNLVIIYGSTPNVTDQAGGGILGGTLNPGETLPLNIRGPLYIYAPSGAPVAEFVPILKE